MAPPADKVNRNLRYRRTKIEPTWPAREDLPPSESPTGEDPGERPDDRKPGAES